MRQLTMKQQKYVAALVRLGNKREAVIDAGYHVKSRKAADGFVYALNSNPRVQKAIQKQLSDSGITLEKIVNKWAEALEHGCGPNATNADHLFVLKSISKMLGLL
ncbi:MAG: terminase small subunit [Patescibacteria group bacterium]|nr:terminase small subunit [Patescibacteria group bacterium]